MKHLKKYENWTTTTSHDVELKYDNDFQEKKPKKVSQLIENTKEYIELNFKHIYEIIINEDGVGVNFNTPPRKNRQIDVKSISIGKITRGAREVYQIKLVKMEDTKDFSGDNKVIERNKYVDILKYEYEYMREFLIKLQDKHVETSQRDTKSDLEDILDPAKIMSKKYNL